MDWLERMNCAINYIEENITHEIDYKRISQISCCSAYNFQRMFSIITNVTLSEYIRRRRLTLAAYELQNNNVKIIDLAIKYGYDSHESFSRTFQKLHGISPSIARKKGILLKAYPRISFQITIKGDVEMHYRIEVGKPSSVFGKSVEVSYAEEKCYKDIEEFVAQSWVNGLRQEIRNAAGYGVEEAEDAKLLGIALHGFKEDGSFKLAHIFDTIYLIHCQHPFCTPFEVRWATFICVSLYMSEFKTKQICKHINIERTKISRYINIKGGNFYSIIGYASSYDHYGVELRRKTNNERLISSTVDAMGQRQFCTSRSV